jgi:hypothetical protein
MSQLVRHGINTNKLRQKFRMLSREDALFATMMMIGGFAYLVLSHQRNKKKLLSGDCKLNNHIPQPESSNIIFIVDNAAGSARRILTPTLKEVGIYIADGNDDSLFQLLSSAVKKNESIDEKTLQETIIKLILTARTSKTSLASQQQQQQQQQQNKVGIFMSAVVFRGLGNQILKTFPFAKWVFAYNTALEALLTCSCYSDECYPTIPTNLNDVKKDGNTKSSSSSSLLLRVPPLSMRLKGASEFGEQDHFIKYLDELPKQQQSKLDAWLGAMDLMFTIKNNEDEDNELNKKNVQNLAQHRLNLWFQRDSSSDDKDKKKSSSSDGGGVSTGGVISTGTDKKMKNSNYAEQAFETEKRLADAMKLSGGHGFAPFTLRMSFLINEATRMCTLQQLLQFLFYGIPGNDVHDSILKTACDCMSKALQFRPPSLSHMIFCPSLDVNEPGAANKQPTKIMSTLSELAFAHKRLLLHDKVILDTILPEKKTNWRLRSKVKKGCGCCAPEEDEDVGDGGNNTSQMNKSGGGGGGGARPDRMAMPGGFAMAKKRRPTPPTTNT